MAQVFDFGGATYKAAREKRQRYEDICQQTGTIAHRVAPTTWHRVNDGWVTITTWYDFTDLNGVWTATADANGILQYWWL